ncbi:P-loop containing nucleoside triphosphate hydrolase protein, partial [Mycena albidolilacea]
LPSEPKIFHGRELQVSHILELFSQDTPRIAILGAGGIGKTILARILLHHTDITARYGQQRFFVACDTASAKADLAGLIGAHLGLKPGEDLTRAVIQHFSNGPPSLLILDNLETVWEPMESRGQIEEFLSLLTDVVHLALMITMRGAERPSKVKWTHPFVPPLIPLSADAARHTFIEIADTSHDPELVDQVLALTDYLPLAISLVASLVDSEGCQNVLARWEQEKTSMISDGYDRRSNLDLSISLSLSSPRLNAHARDLLSLLSILPDGFADVDLIHSGLPLDNIRSSRAALVATALAYTDGRKRLKALVPIREYMQKSKPPGDHLIRPLLKYFHDVLAAYVRDSFSSPELLPPIYSNFSNIQNLLRIGLSQG